MTRPLVVSFKVKPVPCFDYVTEQEYLGYPVPTIASHHLSERPSWASRDLAEVFSVLKARGVTPGARLRSDALPLGVTVADGSLLSTVTVTIPAVSHWRGAL